MDVEILPIIANNYSGGIRNGEKATFQFTFGEKISFF